MDSPDSDPVRSAIWNQGQHLYLQEQQVLHFKQEFCAMVERQEGMLAAVSAQLHYPTTQVSQTSPPRQTTALTSSPSTPNTTVSTVPVQLARPERFSGDSGDCRSFLTQCELHFELQTQMFQSEPAKIASLISHLTSRAEVWATAEWARRSPTCESYSHFSQTPNLSKLFS